jgi:hypothetical protein
MFPELGRRAGRPRENRLHPQVSLAARAALVRIRLCPNHLFARDRSHAGRPRPRRKTDLGERIVQLAGEAPSHIVLPAIHKKKEDVGEIFHPASV